MECLFWLSLVFIGYTYIGYPLLIKLLSVVSSKPVDKSLQAADQPNISVVLTIRNESVNIRKKLLNLSQQSYPPEKMEIIVVSDGSDDDTADIVQQWIEEHPAESHVAVKLLQYEVRQGKPNAVNLGVANAMGEVVILADARQQFMADAIIHLVANFRDPTVGCVSGELLFKDDEESEISSEMGAYWKYEKWIRKTESRTGSVVGVTGAIYAIRKSLFCEIPKQTLLDDVFEPMSVALKGYRILFDESAQAVDVVSKNADQEWTRKVRTLAGNWQLINLAPGFFLSFSNPVCWRFWSHKICRLLVPFAMLLLLVASLSLDQVLYQVAAGGQVIFYLVALAARYSEALRQNRWSNLCYFFMVLNMAVVVGFYYWITGKVATIWTPAYKKGAPE